MQEWLAADSSEGFQQQPKAAKKAARLAKEKERKQNKPCPFGAECRFGFGKCHYMHKPPQAREPSNEEREKSVRGYVPQRGGELPNG